MSKQIKVAREGTDASQDISKKEFIFLNTEDGFKEERRIEGQFSPLPNGDTTHTIQHGLKYPPVVEGYFYDSHVDRYFQMGMSLTDRITDLLDGAIGTQILLSVYTAKQYVKVVGKSTYDPSINVPYYLILFEKF